MARFIPVFVLFLSLSFSFAQESINVDTTKVLLEEDVSADYGHENVVDSLIDTNHRLYFIDSLHASTDTSGLKYDTSLMSELAKAVVSDSLYWMSIDTNFALFDSMSVNPYGFKAEKFQDTVPIVLYDTLDLDTSRKWSMPLDTSVVNSEFGLRHYKWHYGTDLDLEIGDSVFACFDGVVRISKYNRGGYGYYLLIRHHNGLETLYGHLDKRLAVVGQHVKAGELIGWGGNTGRSTGPHLHFEVRYHGAAINPRTVYDFKKHNIKGPVLTVVPEHFKYIKDMKAARYHRIRSGDTLSGLAVRYHTSVRRICRLNRISSRTVLRIGRRLRVR